MARKPLRLTLTTDSMNIILTFGVLGLTFVCFIFEWLPVDITAISVVVLLALLGLVTPDQALAGFSNPATIAIMSMFILSAGIERTGAIQMVSNFLLKQGGKNPSRQVFVLGAIVGPITAFLSNTAVVAVFIPIVEEWCRKQNISVSKLLIPLSYATVLGGTITVIGTSTNVVASGLAKDLGFGEFGLFDFTSLGLITFIVGLVYLALFAPYLLPERKTPDSHILTEDYGLKEYFSEIVIPPRSSLIGESLRSSELEKKFDLKVLELVHNNNFFNQPLKDKVLSAGDILIIRGRQEDLLKIKTEREIELFPDLQFKQEDLESQLNSGDQAIAEVLIVANSSLVGTTLKDFRFRRRYNATVLAIRRGEELIRDRLREVQLRFGDVLLVQGPKQSFKGLQTCRDLLVIEAQDLELMRPEKAGIALAIGLAVVIAAAFNIVPISIAALAGVVLTIVTGVLKPREIYGVVRWDIIFLLAGLIPLGTAMDNSGATQWLADRLVVLGDNVSGFWLLVFFYVATTLLTEILSNNAAVILMFPVAVKVAETLSFNPFAFMLIVMFAASNSYLTPIGYQTNTMVYGPGGYKFLDFTRVGAPLNLILTLLTPFLVIWLYGLEAIS